MAQQPIETEWSDTFILNLPQELFSKVTHYITKYDLIECACVSARWHVKVQPLLYRSLRLTDRHNFKQFHKLLEDSTRKTKRRKVSSITKKPRIQDIGHYVYALELEDGILTTNMMQQLAVLCPYVRQIHFSWNSVLPEPATPHKITRAFRNPMTFLQHFQPSNLVQLTLTCTPVKVYSLSDIADALRYTPQLQTLELKLLLGATLSEMEYLHMRVPELMHLCINCAEVQVEDASLSLSEFETIIPAVRMQSFTFLSDVWSHDLILESLWFRYILRKYPRLKCLGLYHSDQFWSRDPTNEPTTDMSIIMRNYFPELQSLQLDMLAGKSIMAWPDLVRDMPKIKLHGADATGAFSNWIRSDATKQIEHLELSTLPATLSEVSHCMHLRYLELCGHFPRGAYQAMPLGTILSDCKSLDTMSISHCTIYYNRAPTASNKSPLKTLMLKDTLLLTHDSLAYIGIQCPQLTHLQLKQCAWGMRAYEPIIRIHMPQQLFAYFEIVKPVMFSEYGKTDDTPFQQAGYIPLDHYHVTNEYLMMKTPVKSSNIGISSLMYNAINWLNPFNMLNMWYKGDLWSKHRLQLFHVNRSNALIRIALTKIANFNMKGWSDFLICDGSSNRRRAEELAKELMIPLISFENASETQHCITTLCCRGVSCLYIDGVRVDLEKD